eukprot:CAMPEP_0170383574 /NCGR_PEP_ID=MMETSP0117_2-20130122/15544_1 /TAXON_ID=400756 /ORGANISM="Durinskia baltica, Strain CSIRO CS-38" /LENGTH=238 /DNA_ID=CAMNT_0010639279 /DNA_START=79 /DNA_END=795 /DNA_ORIENTATION=+
MSQSDGKVYLNVYDLHENNEMLYPIGLGMFHSGVQIGRIEYTFAGGAGIYSHEPKQVPAGVKLRESIDMGNFRGTSSQIDKVISEMRETFTGSSYHIFDRNCNTFADAFLQRLIGVGAPAYVNRMAYMGSFFSCFLPENLNQDPTQQQNHQGSGGGGGNAYSSSSTSGGVYRTGGTGASQHITGGSSNRGFSGTSGTKLGGAGQTVTDGNGSSSLSVEDRREKIRLAALTRASGGSSS